MTQDNTLPILYSFRRCPYAMRARLALYYAGVKCEIREVVLRDKPPELLAISAKATVPVLLLPDGTIIEESYDILKWALEQNDPKTWSCHIDICDQWVKENDGYFKAALNKYKYSSRHIDDSSENHRKEGEKFLLKIEKILEKNKFILGDEHSIVDLAIFPFIRQFAFVDKEWFGSSSYQYLKRWLDYHLSSKSFLSIMHKYKQWNFGDKVTYFPHNSD